MINRSLTTIRLFVASGAETKPLRDDVERELSVLSRIHEDNGFAFQLLRWEDESAAVSATGRSQDEYNKLIDKSDMVAVIIKDHLGKYTKGEFYYAVDLFQSRGTGPLAAPKVIVYKLPTNVDDNDRHDFLLNLRPADCGMDYFPATPQNDDQLIHLISHELIGIKAAYEAGQKASIQGVAETVERMDLDSGLTKEAVELFEQGDYIAASAALDMDKIRKRAEVLSAAEKNLSAFQKKVAQAFVLKAKLELTDVQNKNRFALAQALFEEALRASHGPGILLEYALYCQAQNIYDKSNMLYAEALQRYREQAAVNPVAYTPYVATTLNNLANLHSDNHDYAQAEEEYLEALALRRELAVENPLAYNPDVAITLNNLAILHRNNNEYEQAEKEYNEALALRRELAVVNPAAYNPDVAITLNNLAILHRYNNEYEQAEKEYNEALALRRDLAAANPAAYNSNVANTLNNLAILHRYNNEHEQAEKEYNEALALRRDLAAVNPAAYNPDVATTLNNLAILHSDNNEYERAENEYNEALKLYRDLAAANPAAYNPDVAMTLNNLAVLRKGNNEYEQAEKEFNEALNLRRELAAANPAAYTPYVATTLNNLAILHRDSKDYKQAEKEYNEALALRRELAAVNPAAYIPDVATTLSNLAVLHKDQGNYEQAGTELNEALELITPFYKKNPKVQQNLYDKIKQNLSELP